MSQYTSKYFMCLEERNEILIPVGGKLILHCNFDTSKLRIYLPSFYKQCLDAWSEVNAKTPSLLHEIANEVIWNNKLLCINKKSVYRRDIADLGFLKICDLFSTCWEWGICLQHTVVPINSR